MIHFYRESSIEVVRKAARSVLEHLFDDHRWCDIKWCKPLRQQQAEQKNLPTNDPAGPRGRYDLPPNPERPLPPARPAQHEDSSELVPLPEEKKENRERKGYYRSKILHRELYLQMKPIWMKLTTDEKLYECMHTENSQRNEAMNTSVAKYARKGRTYCTTMSLTNRVMLAMGTQNLGYYGYWSKVFEVLRIEVSPSFKHHLLQKDRKKERKRKYESTPERKKKRAKRQYEKMADQIQKQIEDEKRGKTYGAGIAMETENSIPLFVKEDDQRKKKLKSMRCPLLGCLGRNHASSRSKQCKYHGCQNNEEYLSELRKYLISTYPTQYGKYEY